MALLTLIKKYSFITLLFGSFVLSDYAIAKWDPVTNSMRYQNDFAITLAHHDWKRSGPLFYGNSAVTAGYIEEQSTVPLVEMGLAYGHITDLQGILQGGYYIPQGQIVLGIDAHLMIDSLTDPSLVYPWLRPWYQPYVYYYRDYIRDLGTYYTDKYVLHKPVKKKSLFYKTAAFIKGNKSDDYLAQKWKEYNDRFGWMTLDDFKDNIAALKWVIGYCRDNNIDLKVVWTPWNPKYPHLPYYDHLKKTVDGILADNGIPTLDLVDTMTADKFWDLVHLNRDKGGPAMTKEVDEWLLSFEKSSK